MNTSDIVVSSVSASTMPYDVDLCLDATPSMDGFAAAADSTYTRFLDDLEAVLSSGVKNVRRVRFFKFGETIREIARDEFRSARSRAFYHEPGIFSATNIELVFQPTLAESGEAVRASVAQPRAGAPRERRVIVVVTDLFQRDQDVNAVVQQIRTRCLSDSDCSVGLLAIPSPFDGTVYDALVPSYPYRSTADSATYRPFYLLMFGPEDELRRFADVLSSRRLADLRRMTIIGSRTVSTFSAAVKPVEKRNGVVETGATCGAELQASFNLQKRSSEARLEALVKIAADPQSFGFNPARVAVRAFREENGKLIPADADVKLVPSVVPDGIRIGTAIRPPPARGDYAYVVEVLTGEIDGFVTPRWIAELTSPDPRPDRDPAKTLNLDRFVEQLIATSVLDDRHQPKLARFRVLIRKL